MWKEVAISCSFLWRELEISRNIPRCYFERSGVRPLTLWFYQDIRAPGVTLDQYSTHFPRARKLSLIGMPEDNGAQAFDGLHSLPLLEELYLIANCDEPLPEIFISGRYPNLRRLMVTLGPNFQWHYTIFSPNLRYLEIINCGLFESEALTGFINGLRSMVSLENLRLTNIPSVDIEPLAAVSAVTLSKLRYLTLNGFVEECTALLKCFTLPLDTNIDMRCKLPSDDDDAQIPEQALLGVTEALLDLSAALADKIALRDNSGSMVSPPIKYMLIQHYAYCIEDLDYGDVVNGAMRLRFLRSDKPFGESLQKNLAVFNGVSCERDVIHLPGLQKDLAGIQVMLTWDTARHQPELKPIVMWPRAICHCLPLEQVTTVSLDLGWHTTAIGIGRMCPNVTTVIAQNQEYGFNGLSYLLNADDNGNRRANRPHFSKLKTLVLDFLNVPPSISLCQELDRMRLSLRGLRISRTLTLEKFYIARKDPVGGDIGENYLPKLRAIKAAFPEIDISLLDKMFLQWA